MTLGETSISEDCTSKKASGVLRSSHSEAKLSPHLKTPIQSPLLSIDGSSPVDVPYNCLPPTLLGVDSKRREEEEDENTQLHEIT